MALCQRSEVGLFGVIKLRTASNKESFVSTSVKSQAVVPHSQNTDRYSVEVYTRTASNQGYIVDTNIRSQAESSNPEGKQDDSVCNASFPVSFAGFDNSVHDTSYFSFEFGGVHDLVRNTSSSMGGHQDSAPNVASSIHDSVFYPKGDYADSVCYLPQRYNPKGEQ